MPDSAISSDDPPVYYSCGNIAINGGSVTATGGNGGAGIGCGRMSCCGTIDIAFGITRVVAVKVGDGKSKPIGKSVSVDSECGAISIDASLTDVTSDDGMTRTISHDTPPWNGNLAELDGEKTIEDGTTIYGTLGGNYRLTIADGATVVVSNAVVNGANSSECKWAGISCLGDSTIVLKGENTVRGFYEDYPGIFVPEGKTLTIRGSGSLAASSNGYAPGIGAGTDSCGNIVINGGTITATGGVSAAGIGGSFHTECGDITISGGTVTAAGGDYSPGIGSGRTGVCGGITISGGRVTATCGNHYDTPIGAGQSGSCGELAVSDTLTVMTSDNGRICTIGYWYGNLPTLEGDVTIKDGMEIFGQLTGDYRISIADGATVTLRNVTINREGDEDHSWAGITCVGDATIILKYSNTVKGFYEDSPGIYVPPSKTLTIRGNGSLAASSNGYGAGIGGGFEIDCGNIVIESGTITATGGDDAAGIGGSYGASCGDITVNGGIVVAKGGACAAGIGSGWDGSCGDISFGAGIARVTATAGDGCGNPIGAGVDGTSGEVTLHSDLRSTTSDGGSTVKIEPRIIDLANVTSDMAIPDGYIVIGSHSGTNKISIADGATVTLRGVSINPDGHNYNYPSTPWAGITCLGDATIILEGDNTVKGCNEYWPGIYVPSGSTLTIQGDGALAAAGSGFYGAGIGGGFGQYGKGGSIVIDGGVITATGGAFGAGIGSSGSNSSMDDTASSCMYITINGGSVTATGGAGAAGIGGGCCYANGGYGDDIIIAGGTVTATGGANAAGIGTGENGYCISITIGPKITRVVATCGEGCENPIGAGVDGVCENKPDVASSLSDETSVDGRTRVLARQAISGYDAWAEENGLSGAWDATDANGIHNVFRYAFDKPTGDFALIGIEFNDAGKAVVVTPPLVNGEGFALSILATDRCDGEGAAATSYPLDPSGKTTIDETVSGSRFFRLKAEEE